MATAGFNASPTPPERLDGSACVVIPMHNESAVVAGVVRGVLSAFSLVVCVDDGSDDGSAQVARDAGATVLEHPVNLGQGAALRTGIAYALSVPGVEYIVTFDADGQHDPSDAARLLATARHQDLEAVLGSRFLDDNAQIPFPRRLVLRCAIRFTRMATGLPVSDAHNGLRVFSRSAAERLRIEQSGMAHASEILSEVARRQFRYAEVPVSIAYTDYSRTKGQSNLNAINVLHELFTARLRITP